MNIATWERTIEQALKDRGLAYHPQYSAIALMSPRPPEAKGLGGDIMIAMEREFWRRVCAREAFGDPKRVEARFGRSLEANYGVTRGPFLDVAKAYWTFKLEMSDILPAYYDTWIGQALIALEFNLASLFFPTPGAAAMPKSLRKMTQRQYLKANAPTFETERFLKENPMLRGWFG
jgi:hypothetical protein